MKDQTFLENISNICQLPHDLLGGGNKVDLHSLYLIFRVD